jgi:hypothetical protein
MMLVGFTFHPWVRLMRAHGVTPRALADDLTIMASGNGHEARLKEAFECTFHYLLDIGAKPAPSKCFTFSTCADTRFRLSMQIWRPMQQHIKVVLSSRDLGGHLSIQAPLTGGTLTKRLRKASSIATRLSCMPWEYEAKQKIIQTLVYPLGLYGCEACPAAEVEMAKLGVGVAKAIGPYSQHSANIAVSLLAKKGNNFSITCSILYRSMSLLRRILAKHPEVRERVQDIFRLYLEAQNPGALALDVLPEVKAACPPPGAGSRRAWKVGGGSPWTHRTAPQEAA